MTRIRLLPIIAMLLAIAGGVWWFMTFERVTESVYSGLKGAAAEDPYLALRQLLRRNNIPLEEPAVAATPAVKFDNLPPRGTLLLGDRRHVLMTPERVQNIVAWVGAGGHLIVEAEYPGRPDPLLAAFGLGRIALERPKPASDGDETPEVRGESRADNEDAREGDAEDKAGDAAAIPRGRLQIVRAIAEVHLPDGGRALKIEFGAYQNLQVLSAHGLLLSSDSAGLRFATGAHGAGRVSAISNFDWMIYRGTFDVKDVEKQPTHIGKHDHAEMMLRLVRLNPDHAKAALRLVWGDDDVSLWTWLADHAALALISLALLLVLWLWRVVPRFGPLMPEAAPAEQKLSSHLEAVGRFYWQHMTPAEIDGRLRTACLQRLTERRPGIAMRNANERNAELAQIAGVRVEAVARALDQPTHSMSDLIRNAVLLQRLSQKL